jgi:hypothetical protein
MTARWRKPETRKRKVEEKKPGRTDEKIRNGVLDLTYFWEALSGIGYTSWEKSRSNDVHGQRGSEIAMEMAHTRTRGVLPARKGDIGSPTVDGRNDRLR